MATFGGFRRALRVVRRLHLPQFEYAVEHRHCHAHNQALRKPLLYAVRALAVGNIAGDDQGQDAHVDRPVHRLRHDEVERAEAGKLVEHEWQDRYHRQQFGGAQRDVDGARSHRVQQPAVRQLMEQRRNRAH